MNERIRELYKSALNGTDGEEDMVEKFAELIVKECLLKVNGAKIRGETIDELIERIKDDFGVE